MKKYIKASFDASMPDWLRKDRFAIAALNDAGIDLANCVFSREKRGKMGDNYVVYRIHQPSAYQQTKLYKEHNPDAEISYNDFIWIPGIYNDDRYVGFIDYNKYDYRIHDYRTSDKAVKYYPKKDLNIIDTVYIYKATNKKPKRAHYEDPRYDSNGNYAGQAMIPDEYRGYGENRKLVEPAHWSRGGSEVSYGGRREEAPYRDKSGYTIPNPKNRLEKFYNTKEGMTRRVGVIRTNLDSVYTQLEDIKDRVFNSILPRGSRDDYRSYSVLYEYLDRAIGYYEGALNLLEKLDKYGISESDWSSSYNVSEALSLLKKAQQYVADLNKMLDKQQY